MTSLAALSPAVQALYPEGVRTRYEIHEWRNATVVFKGVHPGEWDDLMTVLAGFRLLRSHVVTGGGNKSSISRSLDSYLYRLG